MIKIDHHRRGIVYGVLCCHLVSQWLYLWGWIGVTGFTRAILWLIAWMIVGTIADRILIPIILAVVGGLSSIFFEKRR